MKQEHPLTSDSDQGRSFHHVNITTQNGSWRNTTGHFPTPLASPWVEHRPLPCLTINLGKRIIDHLL